MKNEEDEVVFKQPVRFSVLPVKGFDKFRPTDTTPSVKNLETWVANNTVPITVTDFDDGANEQRIKVLGDGFTTVANNAHIKTSTGAALLLAANLIYVFTHINGIWYEDAGSGGGGGVGPTGPSGKDGINFFPRDGKDGKDSLIPGQKGQTGNTGNTGSQGIQGPPAIVLDGKKGDWGFPGPSGKDGTNGIVGTNGKDGVSFIARDGKNGVDGFPGKDGKAGIQGVQGNPAVVLDGKQGPMGFSIPGKDGINGINGLNGKDGQTLLALDGKTGQWGFPGQKGDKGDQGIQGPAGSGGSGGSSQLIMPRDGIPGPMGISMPAQGIKVSSLPLGALGLTTEFPVNNAGVSQKVTGQLLADFAGDTITNASIADQAVGASATAYITDSLLAVPTAKLRLRSWFRWKFWVDKTAAGTIALVFLVKIGTLGTTGDTTLFTITLGVGTAVVDTGWLDVTVILRGPLTNLGIFILEAMFDHTLAATGLNNVQRQTQQTVSAAFDVTTAGLKLGLAVTTPALYALTFRAVTAEAKFL